MELYEVVQLGSSLVGLIVVPVFVWCLRIEKRIAGLEALVGVLQQDMQMVCKRKEG